MLVEYWVLPLLAVSLPTASAQLNVWARKAGLKYFGAATDSPGQRERAGFENVYPRYDAILRDTREFGQTTPTNGQKWAFVEPEPGVFNFTEGEIVSSIAEETGQYLRCHALVWHSQLAPWVETTEWTPKTLTKAIKTHVRKVASHWRGRCYAWDVVNEALNEDGTYRESVFYKVLGEEYIKIAFREAAKADPHAKLYYNDYNLESPSAKSEGAIRIVKMLQDDGIKVDGIGMQAHLVAHRAPSLDDQIAVMKSYAKTGVEVALTELDVRIELPVNKTNMAWQKEAYGNAVGACAQVKACVGITIWDFYDPFSWVPYVFDGEGAALLWFEDFSRHPAYYGALDALKNGTRHLESWRSVELCRNRKQVQK
ncbi:family 10 glycosyl hydrolase [Ilyonectria robusta]|uniref:family 10 glycosyl hydrolase n=1 Tax=Ilyonectria robusta TaxID=1079257 RepID=UPI001E8D0DB4|nr:family 10 glycosyl hydrolase [Ilyonectria robusta]KAH8714653.1 family 10 glycosyl hydrolase [Ilyonectria robusta]